MSRFTDAIKQMREKLFGSDTITIYSSKKYPGGEADYVKAHAEPVLGTTTQQEYTPNPSQAIPGFTTWNPPKNLADMVVSAANKYGIHPAVLAGVIQTESGFNPNTPDNTGVSESGRTYRDRGMAQINDYWNPGVTDTQAYDPQFAIDFAAKRIADQYNSLGDLLQAIASYNVGNRVGYGGGRNERGLGPKGEYYVSKVFKNIDPNLLQQLGLVQ